MRSGLWMVMVATVALSACGGGTDPLATLCSQEAASRLSGQVYRLDEAKLSASKTTLADGNISFKAEVVFKPGTSGETRQTMDCRVADVSGDTPARVIDMSFNVSGSGLTNTGN